MVSFLTGDALSDCQRWLIITVALCNKRSVGQGEFLKRFLKRFFMKGMGVGENR